MNQIELKVMELEKGIWVAAQNRDAKAWQKVVEEDAVMVCGGFRCTGKDYAGVIGEFDVESYDIHDYETVFCSEDLVQIHYVIDTKVKEERNKDLEGSFHVTSTWRKQNGEWKLIFNMDSRIIEYQMPEQQYIIRVEEEKEYHAVEELVKRAFWNVNEPGSMEHYLANQLRLHKDFIPELDLVLEKDNQVIAAVMYTHSILKDESGNEKDILTFGPVSVDPAYQRQGYGKALLEASFEKAIQLGFDTIAIYGNPDNYVERGFKSCKKYNVCVGDKIFPGALMIKELKEGCLDGRLWFYEESKAYEVDMSKFDAFDAGFEQLKKEYRPYQEQFYIGSHSRIVD